MKAGGEEIMSLHSFRKIKIPMFYIRCMHFVEFFHTALLVQVFPVTYNILRFKVLSYIP